MFFPRFAKLVARNKEVWRAGLAVVVMGTTFKFAYFNFSRGVMVNTMEQRHLQAAEHLRGAREYGSKKAREREDRAPPLTAEQKEQLREYLKLLRQAQPDVYPKESGRW
eukprot:CAMPEP_0172528068 /NCGR_PEP_ID=MMETSP1067-20121228/2580_1 /TAXON_ID=265564 ORGANISM="Thalassiosira punctigera, Strain Tpunct2005C2" /NCGR_SAMPLE_ID=MMETSP1067 /ASSEMBLY_ACC=CAM_ASM_000444 /LENGTH=108 /DNA_ID=CAMNT_0013311927 /DNA_START=69 /DNA_END=392 /DNA_ORIENTATION=+